MKTSVVNNMFKQKYWIRFELGPVGLEEKAYVNEVMQRSNSICNIETLEIWLRRLIDQQLRESFGLNYLQYQDSSGDFIIKKLSEKAS